MGLQRLDEGPKAWRMHITGNPQSHAINGASPSIQSSGGQAVPARQNDAMYLGRWDVGEG